MYGIEEGIESCLFHIHSEGTHGGALLGAELELDLVEVVSVRQVRGVKRFGGVWRQ